MLPTTAFIETFKLMGAIPTPIPFNELYTAVQTGVVDGFEHDAATVVATKLYEVSQALLADRASVQPDDRRDRQARARQGAGRPPARAPARPRPKPPRIERGQAAEKGSAAVEELKRLGITFHPMAKAEREAVRKEMETRLWTPFAVQYPTTKPLFAIIASTRA